MDTNNGTCSIGRRVIDNKSIVGIVNVLCIFMGIFYPTSHNTVIADSHDEIILWGLLIAVVIFFAITNRISLSTFFFLMIFVNGYMVLVTYIARIQFGQTRISIARIAPLVVLFFVLSLRINQYPRIKTMKILLNVVSVIAVLWNALIMIQNQAILDFTYNHYNQYYPLCGYYQVIIGHKPVMSFGVHTYASYFYFLFFACCFATYKHQKKNIYLFYSVAYCLFCMVLGSVSSFIFFAVMISFLIKEVGNRMSFSRLCIVLLILFFIIAVGILNYKEISEKVAYSFTSGNNGFLGRYTSESSLTENYKVITSSLGIGYNIVDNLAISYSDSGYILYLTMGSVPLLLAVYCFLYKFIKRNFIIYNRLFLFVIFGFELALPATFNYRFSYLILFVICYLGSLCKTENCLSIIT